MRIGRIAETRRTSAKRFGSREQLRVNLEPDDRFVRGQDIHRAEDDKDWVSVPCGLARDPDAWDRPARDADCPYCGCRRDR